MFKIRNRRLAENTRRNRDRLAAIEASLLALDDEDLLDLADIFARGPSTPLREIAAVEMRRRNISL